MSEHNYYNILELEEFDDFGSASRPHADNMATAMVATERKGNSNDGEYFGTEPGYYQKFEHGHGEHSDGATEKIGTPSVDAQLARIVEMLEHFAIRTEVMKEQAERQEHRVDLMEVTLTEQDEKIGRYKGVFYKEIIDAREARSKLERKVRELQEIFADADEEDDDEEEDETDEATELQDAEVTETEMDEKAAFEAALNWDRDHSTELGGIGLDGLAKPSKDEVQEARLVGLRIEPWGKDGVQNQVTAAKDISTGRILGKYISRPFRKGDDIRYSVALADGTIGDGRDSVGFHKFINHSCDPNCELAQHLPGLSGITIVAMAPIKEGEALTFDYGWEVPVGQPRTKCKCGSTICRGFMEYQRVSRETTVSVESMELPTRRLTEEAVLREQAKKTRVAARDLSGAMRNVGPTPQRGVQFSEEEKEEVPMTTPKSGEANAWGTPRTPAFARVVESPERGGRAPQIRRSDVPKWKGGTITGKDARVWLRDFEEHAELTGWTEEYSLRAVAIGLEFPRAKTWHLSYMARVTAGTAAASWESWKQAFLKAFLDDTVSERACQD